MGAKRAKLFIVSKNIHYHVSRNSDSLSGVPNKNPVV